MKFVIRPSAFILYPYKKFDAYHLLTNLSVWDKLLHKYTQFLYDFDPEVDDPNVGALKLPRGLGEDYVEETLNEYGLRFEKVDQCQNYCLYRRINFELKIPPRDEIQEQAIEFLDNECAKKRQAFLALDVGRGKTYCAISHIQHAKKCAMIISYNLTAQWVERITQYTDLVTGEDGIADIVGTQYFEDVVSGKKKPKAKIYITTNTTLSEYQKKHGQDSLQDIANKLGIGIKIFDEAHNRYIQFNSIDLNMQTDETIYLSATPGRSARPENRVFTRIYRTVPHWGGFTSKLSNFYTIRYINYDSHSRAEDRVGFKTPRGLSSLKYTKYLFDKYGENILRLVMYYTYPILKKDENGKLLIVTDLLSNIEFSKKWLNENYPQFDVGTYCLLINDKEEREKQLDCRIILGTIGSMQNGKDIPNLQIIFPITCFGSSIVTRQLLGRLRPLKDKYVYYFDIADITVPSIMHQRELRNDIFKDKAISLIETDRVDLDRI